MDKLVTEVFQKLISDKSYAKYHNKLKQYVIDHDPDMFVPIHNTELTVHQYRVLAKDLGQCKVTKNSLYVSQTLYTKYKKGSI